MPTSKELLADFSTRALLSEAYDIFKKNWQPFIILMVISIPFQILSNVDADIGILTESGITINPNVLIAMIIASSVLNSIISYITLSVSIDVVQGKKITTTSDYFSKMNRFLSYILLNIMIGIIVVIGFLLLIIPGIAWSYKYLFAIYAHIDGTQGVRESLRISASMTEGIKWKLFRIGFVIALFNMAGLLALGVGLLVTAPVSVIAVALLYEKLKPESLRQPDSEMRPTLVEQML